MKKLKADIGKTVVRRECGSGFGLFFRVFADFHCAFIIKAIVIAFIKGINRGGKRGISFIAVGVICKTRKCAAFFQNGIHLFVAFSFRDPMKGGGGENKVVGVFFKRRVFEFCRDDGKLRVGLKLFLQKG